jgi:hypothetical protein
LSRLSSGPMLSSLLGNCSDSEGAG